MDTRSEHAPLEDGSSAEVTFQEAGINLRHFIEAEPPGTAMSKAFCDFADLTTAEAHLAYKPKLRMVAAAIGEKIRERENEVPGYKQAMSEVRNLFKAVYDSIDREHGPKGTDSSSLGWLGRPNDADRFLESLKQDYIDGKLTPAISSPDPK